MNRASMTSDKSKTNDKIYLDFINKGHIYLFSQRVSVFVQNNNLLTAKRLPFREKYMDLLILNFCANNQNKTAAEKNMKHVRFFFSSFCKILREEFYQI